MIKIDFSEPDIDEWKEWCNDCSLECAKLIKAFENYLGIEIDHNLYKRFKFVFLDPKGPFKGKCSYCEDNIFINQHGDIEHYRPKSKITDDDNKPIMIIRDGKEIEHPGYFWLAYDWNNLLLSCVLCNQASSQHSDGKVIGKRNKFPVKGFRACKPGEEINEEPLLINPVKENPEDFLDISDDGVLYSKDGNIKGETTIEILGLNDRNLPSARKEVYDNTRNKLGVIIQAITTKNIDSTISNKLADIKRTREGYGEFSIAARKALKDSVKDLEPLFNLLQN